MQIFQIIDPKSDEEDSSVEKRVCKTISGSKVNRKGVTLYSAEKLMRERNYYAAMMVNDWRMQML